MAVSKDLVAQFLKRKFNNERERLNTQYYHFMPLNLEAFKIVLLGSVEDEKVVTEIYEGLKTFLVSRHKAAIPVSSLAKMSKKELDAGPYLVYEGSKNNIVGVLYKDYNSAYGAGFRNYLNSVVEKSIKTIMGTITIKEGPAELLNSERYGSKKFEKYNKGFDVGHMFAGAEAQYGDTPLSYKLRILKQALDNLVSNKLVLASRSGVIPGSDKNEQLLDISAKVQKALLDLERKSSLGVQVTATMSKSVNNALASIKAVIVLPQDRLVNQYDYGVLVERAIERDIAKLLVDVKFSPSMLESIEENIVNTLKGKPSRAVRATTVVKTTVKNIIKSKGVLVKQPPVKLDVKVPNQNKTPALLPLVSLKDLLNQALSAQIAKNMGTGTSTNILNYRSGRLASSARIDRLTLSKEGMLSAYYSYMKYPYATFSTGGRQELPRSRDPKLLISKSIREVASKYVNNRMRAVLV